MSWSRSAMWASPRVSDESGSLMSGMTRCRLESSSVVAIMYDNVEKGQTDWDNWGK